MDLFLPDQCSMEKQMSNRIRFGSRHIHLPKSRLLRIALGVVLLVGGIFGFLPIVGFWMIPLGFIVLSHDLPSVRRWRRRMTVRWGARWRRRS